MGSFLDPAHPVEERDTSGRTIGIAIIVIMALAASTALFLRTRPQPQAGLPAYASSLAFSNLKMSQAQNFAGGTVTYVDGTLNNLGDQTVTRATVRVTFRDPYGQVAQIEDVPVRILESGGLYEDTGELSKAPLAPGHSLRFRLTFEHISEQWSQGYPELQIADVGTK